MNQAQRAAKQEQERQAEQAQRMAEDLRMMSSPEQWPHFGWLPIKMRNGDWHNPDYCALLNCWDDVKPIVYLANMHSIGEKYGTPSASGKGHFIDLSKVPQKAYPDLKALVAEWTVD